MSCRETHAGSAVTSYVKYLLDGSVSESSILSTFHELRRNHRESTRANQHVSTDAEYAAMLRRYIRQTAALPNATAARKRSIEQRFRAALNDTGNVPPQDLIYALRKLPSVLLERSEAIQQYTNTAAAVAEMPVAQMRERFTVLETEADRRTPLTEEERAFAFRHGALGNDAGVIRAAIALEEEANAIQQARNMVAPPRITRTELARPVSGGSAMPYVAVRAIGYDERNQRVEIETSTRGTTRRTVHAYRNVVPAVFNLLSDPRTTADAWTAIRNFPASQYATQTEADADGRAPRCNECGQYSAVGHTCPLTMAAAETPAARRGRRRVEPEQSPRRTQTITFRRNSWNARQGNNPNIQVTNWSRQSIETEDGRRLSIELPLVRGLRTAANTGPVVIEGFHEWVGGAWVRGDVTVDMDSAGNLAVDTSHLYCNCESSTTPPCEHLEHVEQAVLLRVDSHSEAATAIRLRAAQRRIEQETAENWIVHPPSRAEAETTWRGDSEVLYSQNPAAFQEAVAKARREKTENGGEAVIPYMRENALDGLCQPGSGKGFGMEIEFDIEGPNKSAKIASIARDLKAAGLTSHNTQQGYGASRRRGFVDTHQDTHGNGQWSFERDGSVSGGELVTPVMYDTPETWANLEKAVTIIKRHGGVPSTHAGAHVHVGTGDYRQDAKNYTELVRLMNQHEDVMFRLASDTKRGTHRNTGYAIPLPHVPPAGFASVDGVKRWQPTRATAVNFGGVDGRAKSHSEFRLFDSTLNVGTMQAQIKLAVAATEAAKRIAASGGTSRGKEPVGAHRKRAAAARGTATRAEQEEEESGTTRSLLDVLFRRKEDKEQLAAVYANTQWGVSRNR